MKQKILIVEDEPTIINLLKNRFDSHLYDIEIAYDGKEALFLIENNYYDLISLDIMLPSLDGLTLCNIIRKKSKKSLIFIVSALDTEEKKEKAYLFGADDYIGKPFSPKLVALKMTSLLKRRSELTKEQVNLQKKIEHNSNLKRFYVKEQPLLLTLSEYTILKTLFYTSNKVFSKEELSQVLYNENIGNIDKKGIGTHIYQLRKKINTILGENIIKTVRNIGYTLYED